MFGIKLFGQAVRRPRRQTSCAGRRRHRAVIEALEGRSLLSFTAPVPLPAGYGPAAIAVADFNGDHLQDLVVGNPGDNIVSVLLGNGNGTFQNAVSYPVGLDPTAVVVGDFNGDGHPDIAVNDSGSHSVSVLLGLGDGTFRPAVNSDDGPATIQPSSGPGTLATADVAGDGKLDLLLVGEGTDASLVNLLRGSGDGRFAFQVELYAEQPRINSIATGNYAHTGSLNRAMLDGAGLAVQTRYWDSTPLRVTIPGGPTAMAEGDLEGTGETDFAVATAAGSVAVVRLTPWVDFLSPPDTVYTAPVASHLGPVAVADLNGDGIPDIAVVNQYAGVVTVIPNNGDGTFGSAFDIPVGKGPRAVAVGDFNGDHKADLAVTNGGFFPGGSVSVVLNQPDATRLAFGVQPSNTVAGQTINPAVTVLVEDQYGHVVTTDDTDRVTLGLRDVNGDILHGTTTVTVHHGIATFDDVSVQQGAGTGDTLAATSGGLTTAVSAPFGVAPAALDHLSISAPTKVTAGAQFSLTVTAQDRFGNVIPGYTGTVHVGPADRGVMPADYRFTAADHGAHTFAGVELITAAPSLFLSAADTSNPTVRGYVMVSVLPAAVDHFALAAPAGSTAGLPFDVTVTAQDRFDNTAYGYTGTIHFASTDGAPRTVKPADYTFTVGDQARHTFAGATVLTMAGRQTLTVHDVADTAVCGSARVVVSPAAADHFGLGIEPVVTAGVATPVVVEALDPYGNRATGYTGTVHLAVLEKAPFASLPGEVTFSAADGGSKLVSATLVKAGHETITALDTSNQALHGSDTFLVVPAAPQQLVFGLQPADTIAGQSLAPVVTVRVEDRFGNLVVGDNRDKVSVNLAQNPGSGTLSGITTATAQGGVATFRILWIDKSGSGYQLGAQCGRLSAASSQLFSLRPAAPDHLAFGVQPHSVTVGRPMSPDVEVLVEDRYGNVTGDPTGVLKGGTGVVKVSLFQVGRAKPLEVVTLTVKGGVAVLHGLVVNQTGVYTLRAACNGLGFVDSAAFTVSEKWVRH
jgi:hypothetical protein